jgi:hypothetical protein
MAAEMTQGETQSVTYRSFGFGGGEETVSVTPFISRLKIQVGETDVWWTGTSTGAPPVVSLKEGGSAQQEVDRWQKPNPGFFEKVEIPSRILDPAKRNGLGTTEVTNRGFVPK